MAGMVSKVFDVEITFPKGLSMNRMIEDLQDLWPEELDHAEFTADGSRGPNGVVKTGRLTIRTKRDLTNSQLLIATTLFSNHVVGLVRPGKSISRLPPADVGVRLPPVFASDVPRANGSGNGVLVYSDGTDWRRISDDQIVRQG